MKKLFITILLCFFFGVSICFINAQSAIKLSKLQKENVNINVFEPVREKDDLRKKYPIDDEKVAICFREEFSDSVIVIVNNTIIVQKFVQTDTVTLSGLANLTMVIDFNKFTKRKNCITIILLQKKKYIKFKLDKKYRLINLFRDKFKWNIVKTNYIPVVI